MVWILRQEFSSGICFFAWGSMHFCSQEFNQCPSISLPVVDVTHPKHDAVKPHECGRIRQCTAPLPRTGFGNQRLLSFLSSVVGLRESSVDLVRTCRRQVFTFVVESHFLEPQTPLQ